jgi:hypothetical protein
LLGFFTGTGTTAGVPCVDGGGPVPSKSCGGCVLVKKGRNQVGAIGTLQIPLYTVQSTIKHGKKGFPKLPLFLFLTFCFCVCRPYKLKGRPYILHNRKCSYSTLITLPTPTCKEKCYWFFFVFLSSYFEEAQRINQ